MKAMCWKQEQPRYVKLWLSLAEATLLPSVDKSLEYCRTLEDFSLARNRVWWLHIKSLRVANDGTESEERDKKKKEEGTSSWLNPPLIQGVRRQLSSLLPT